MSELLKHGAITLVIRHRVQKCEYRLNFIDPVFYDMRFQSKGRDRLLSFLKRKAEEAKTHDDVTWDHVAYTVAAEKIKMVPFMETIHTVDWSISLKKLIIEEV